MDILSYLSELLQSRKSIGISGLGTVYKKKIPGRYNAETHSFFPPTFVMDFKTEVQEDSVLAEYICSQKNVSEETALFVIKEFSNGVLKQLNSGEEVYLGNIGKLVKDGQETKFIPTEQLKEGNEFFGLPAVEESSEIPQDSNLKVDQTSEINQQASDNDTAATEIYPELGSVEEVHTETLHQQPVIETAEDIVEEDEGTPAAGVDPAALVSTPVPPMENPVELKEAVTHEEQSTTETNITTEEISQENEIETNGTKTVIDSDQTLNIRPEEDQPIVRKSINDTFKTEEQLRSEIEALNYYRSKAPLSQQTIKHDDEILLKLKAEKDNITNPEEAETASFYHSEDEIVKGTSLFVKIIYGLLILVIAAGVAYVIQPSLFNRLTGNKPGMSQPTDPVNQSTATPILDSTANDTTASSAVSKDPAIKTAIPAVISTDTATVYEVIGASMHNQKEADAFVALMKKSGIEAKVVTNMAGRRLKMSIGTFKDEVTAKQELEKLSKRLKIPGIYIYKNKQK